MASTPELAARARAVWLRRAVFGRAYDPSELRGITAGWPAKLRYDAPVFNALGADAQLYGYVDGGTGL